MSKLRSYYLKKKKKYFFTFSSRNIIECVESEQTEALRLILHWINFEISNLDKFKNVMKVG